MDLVTSAQQRGAIRYGHPHHIRGTGIGQSAALHVQFHIVRTRDVTVIRHRRRKIQVRHQIRNVGVIGIAFIPCLSVVLDTQQPFLCCNRFYTGLNFRIRLIICRIL